MDEGEVITKRGSVARKHKEEVIEMAQDNINRATFPALWLSRPCTKSRGLGLEVVVWF
jgi:hypothetical protein